MGKKKNSDILNDALDIIINGDFTDPTESSKPSNRLKYSYESENDTGNGFMRDEIKSYNFADNVPDDSGEEWSLPLFNSVSFSKKRGKKNFANIFSDSGDSKKKKKKKKVDSSGKEIIDYNKQMEPELNMYRNLLKDQNMFTESLQKEYDALKSSKSLSRGVNKSMSDLIANITSARSLSMQLVKENINAKKIIAELNMKQNKDAVFGDDNNVSDYAAAMLRQMINERGSVLGAGVSDGTVTNYDDESFSDMFDSTIQDDENRPEEVDKYLKYENRNVNIYVQIEGNDIDNYVFIAKDEDGEILDDYPLPNRTKLSVNRSTNIATDTYGKKYLIEWV